MQESRLQESRRMMVEANAHSKVEAPKVVSNDPPQSREKLPRVALLPFVVGLPPVDALDAPPNHGERKNGQLVNTVIRRYTNVSQFWTYDEKTFLANPVYARDYPPAKNLEP